MVWSSAVGRPAGKRPRGVVSAFFACKKRRTPAVSSLRVMRQLWFCGGPLTRGRLLFRVAFSSIGCFGRPHLMRGQASGQPLVHLRASVLCAAFSHILQPSSCGSPYQALERQRRIAARARRSCYLLTG